MKNMFLPDIRVTVDSILSNIVWVRNWGLEWPLCDFRFNIRVIRHVWSSSLRIPREPHILCISINMKAL